MQRSTGLMGRCLLILMLAWAGGPVAAPAVSASPADPILGAQVSTPDYRLTDGGVEVPGYALNTIPGAPRLPLHGITFDLPASGDWEITFESPGSRILDRRVAVAPAPAPDLDLNQPLPLRDLPSHVPVVTRPDPAIYAVDAFYPPSPVVAGEPLPQDGRRILPVRVFPFQYNPITGQLRYHPDLRITVRVRSAQPTQETPSRAAAELTARSFPADGIELAARVYTRERGLYRLTYAELAGAGVPVGPGGRDPRNFAIYHDGAPVDVQLVGGDDGVFDPDDLLIFYAIPYSGRFQSYNVYSLVVADQPNTALMGTRQVSPPSAWPATSAITQTVHVERDLDYRSLYERPMDADHWFDAQLYVNSTNPSVTRPYDMNLADPIPAGTLRLSALIHGGASHPANPDQSVVVRLNGNLVGQYTWNDSTEHQIVASLPAAWLAPGANQVTLEAALSQLPGLFLYWISPDWVRLQYPAQAKAQQNRLYVEGMISSPTAAAVTGFSSPDVAVYDVTDPRRPVRLTGVATQAAGSIYTVAWADVVSAPSYYLSALDALLAPSAVEADALSAWSSPNHQADYIAIVGAQRSFAGTTPLGTALSAAVQPLLDHRMAEGLQVAEVDVLDIYDEFSYGKVDPRAIRAFLAYAYTQWNQGGPRPRYVLLVGDGHYDFTGVSSQILPNLLPPYLLHVDPFWGEVPVDNRFVSIDGEDDYLPNMAIGRMPANSAADVAAMVNKVLTYESASLNPAGLWQQRAVYVADDCNNYAGDFHELSNYGRLQWLPSAYSDSKIYYDNPSDPVECPDGTHSSSAQLRPAVRAAFDQGAFYLQWFGHGSQTNWGATVAFQHTDNLLLNPTPQLPFTTANACLTGYFVWQSPFTTSPYPYQQSLAEIMVITPGKSSVVDLSPSGLHVGNALATLQQGLHQALFQDRIARAGDATDAAKHFFFANSLSWHDLIDTMVLFGDPALKLRHPTGDLAASTLEVSAAAAPLGATLNYTLTVHNTSLFTTSHPLVVVDYPQETTTVVTASGATDDGDTLTWTLDDLPGYSQQAATFTLQVDSAPAPEGFDLVVPASVSSPMAPSVALSAQTWILTAPNAVSSTLAANRDWLPPGFPLTATLTLTHDGDLPAPGVQVTMTLPVELEAPTWLSASTSSLIYDPQAHRITWNGDAPAGSPTTLAFRSLVSPGLTACGAPALTATVTYRGASTPQALAVGLAVPDVDCDGRVTVADIQQVAARWNAQAGSGAYHPRYDLDANNVIDLFDVSAVAQAWH